MTTTLDWINESMATERNILAFVRWYGQCACASARLHVALVYLFLEIIDCRMWFMVITNRHTHILWNVLFWPKRIVWPCVRVLFLILFLIRFSVSSFTCFFWLCAIRMQMWRNQTETGLIRLNTVFIQYFFTKDAYVDRTMYAWVRCPKSSLSWILFS